MGIKNYCPRLHTGCIVGVLFCEKLRKPRTTAGHLREYVALIMYPLFKRRIGEMSRDIWECAAEIYANLRRAHFTVTPTGKGCRGFPA